MKPGLDIGNLLDAVGDQSEQDEKPTADNSFTSETKVRKVDDAQVPAITAFNRRSDKDSVKKKRQFVLSVDPARCRPWRYHDRMEESLTYDRCKDLIEEIANEGQKEPAVVRVLDGDPDYDYEIIYGRRRHFSCSNIRENIDPTFLFDVVIREFADDTDAAYMTWIENEGQTPITDFERGVYFRRLLGKIAGYEKVFNSQDDLCAKFNYDKAKMSKMIQCAALIEEPDILEIISDRTKIPFTGGYKLAMYLSDNGYRKKILAEAKRLSAKKPAATVSAVLKSLLDAVEKGHNSAQPTVYKDKKDNVVLSYTQKANGAGVVAIDKSAKELSQRDLLALFKSLVDDIRTM